MTGIYTEWPWRRGPRLARWGAGTRPSATGCRGTGREPDPRRLSAPRNQQHLRAIGVRWPTPMGHWCCWHGEVVGRGRPVTAAITCRGLDHVVGVPHSGRSATARHRPGAAPADGSPFGMPGVNDSAAYADINSGVSVATMYNKFSTGDFTAAAKIGQSAPTAGRTLRRWSPSGSMTPCTSSLVKLSRRPSTCTSIRTSFSPPAAAPWTRNSASSSNAMPCLSLTTKC